MATQASLDQEINTTLASGVPGGLMANSLRQVLQDMNAAIFQSVPPTAAPSPNTVLAALSSTVSAWTTQLVLGNAGGVGGSLTLNGSTSGSVGLAPDTASDTLSITQGVFGNLLALIGPNNVIANYVSITSMITGGTPSVAAVGTDTNVSLSLIPQGSGGVNIVGAATGTVALNVGGLGAGNGAIRLGANGSSGTISLSTGSTGGILAISGYLATNTGGFQTVSGSAATISSGLVFLSGGSACVLTLPAATFIGQQIEIKMGNSVQTITSASSNVVPLNSPTAGTAIFSSGNLTKFARLVWDGAHWQMTQAA